MVWPGEHLRFWTIPDFRWWVKQLDFRLAAEIAYVVRMSRRLVAAYNRLIDQLADDNRVLKHLLNSDGEEV